MLIADEVVAYWLRRVVDAGKKDDALLLYFASDETVRGWLGLLMVWASTWAVQWAATVQQVSLSLSFSLFCFYFLV
jgi:hypothetical protein